MLLYWKIVLRRCWYLASAPGFQAACAIVARAKLPPQNAAANLTTNREFVARYRRQRRAVRGEPVQPFQAPGLHPTRRRAFAAGMKIEGRPHVHQHGMQTPLHGVGKMVLLRKSQADEDNARPAGIDPADDVRLLLRSQRAERGRIATGNPQSRAPGLKLAASSSSTSGELP